MEESAAYRDGMSTLYVQCRCGDEKAYTTLERIVSTPVSSPSTLSQEDHLVAKGYLGDLFTISKSQLIPRDITRAKCLFSEISLLDTDKITCHHLQYLAAIYHLEYGSNDGILHVPLIEKSIEQGNAISMTTLGYCYTNGLGVKKNNYKSFEIDLRAAMTGYPMAQCNLGYRYDKGRGCLEDPALAAEWFKKPPTKGMQLLSSKLLIVLSQVGG